MDFPIIYGFNQCSEMGDNIFAPSVFIGGCNLRCPYCMNSKLVTGHNEEVEWEYVHDYIIKNKIDWITISGGEPTCINPELLRNLILYFVGIGCKVGLSTNGTNTENLSRVIGLLSYVAMDIKSSNPYIYEKISVNDSFGVFDEFSNVIRTLNLLRENVIDREDFDYEIRTTLYPKYINARVLKEIGFIIRPDEKWVLQQFRNTTTMLSNEACDVNPYTEEEVNILLKIAEEFTSKVKLKYV